MYVSTSFGTSTAEAVDFLSQAVFGDLVSVGPDGLSSTPLPLLYEPGPDGGLGTVVMHLARNNDHWRHADGQDGLLIVRGLDGYVHPGWYPSKAEHGRVVPTWDYEVAHIRGRLAVHDDVEWLAKAVRVPDRAPRAASTGSVVGRGRSAEVHRGTAAGHRRPRAGRLVPSQLKAKMSQNRPQRDIDGVIEGLAADGRADLARVVEARRPAQRVSAASRSTARTPSRLLEPGHRARRARDEGQGHDRGAHQAADLQDAHGAERIRERPGEQVAQRQQGQRAHPVPGRDPGQQLRRDPLCQAVSHHTPSRPSPTPASIVTA